MKRTDKESFVSDFAKNIQSAEAFTLMSFNKISVENMTEFRLALRKQGIRVRVVKNTLAKRVFSESPFKEQFDSHLEGPTMVAYGSGDAVSAAKAIYEWVDKEDLDVAVKGGMALGEVFSEQQIRALSKLPGREQLLTGFLWALNSAPTSFLNAVQDLPRKLGYALSALKDKKAGQEGSG